MRIKALFLSVLLLSASAALCSQITFTFLNFDASTFSASDTQLIFGNAINVLVTNNSNGDSMTLAAVDSGNTGTATHFDPGPPLIADYSGSGANSVLIESGSHVFLAGSMDDSGRFEAEWPNAAGAFLSRFHVTFVDPAILTALHSPALVEPDGSVSLTVAETKFADGTMTATLGGGDVTITTTTPETTAIALMGGGLLVVAWRLRKRGHQSVTA